MATVEINGPIQLVLPESSSAFVFVTPKNADKNKNAQPIETEISIVNPAVFDKAIQAYLDIGEDDFNDSGEFEVLAQAMIRAQHSGSTFEDFNNNLKQHLSSKRKNREGSKMGQVDPVLSAFKHIAMSMAEEIWTRPD